jgi:hypothetical protein
MGAVYGDDIERELGMIATEVRDPRAGIFGPDSILWRVDREACIFLGAGRALMLQLAHPFVAAAIAEHSTTLSDPLRRFHGTFDTMFTLVFGDLEQALAAARRLHRRHAAVTGILPEAAGAFAMGTAYCANETSRMGSCDSRRDGAVGTRPRACPARGRGQGPLLPRECQARRAVRPCAGRAASGLAEPSGEGLVKRALGHDLRHAGRTKNRAGDPVRGGVAAALAALVSRSHGRPSRVPTARRLRLALWPGGKAPRRARSFCDPADLPAPAWASPSRRPLPGGVLAS